MFSIAFEDLDFDRPGSVEGLKSFTARYAGNVCIIEHRFD